MKKNTNRLTAMLMAVLMLLSLLPFTALAASNGTNAACDHQWGEWHTNGSGTCGDWVARERVCIKCGLADHDRYQITHDWGKQEEEYPATCTENGMTKTTCKICGEEKYKYTDPLGHDWGEWHIKSYPHDGMPGIEERECQRCHITEQRELWDDETTEEQYSVMLEFVSASGGTQEGEQLDTVWKLTNTGSKEFCWNNTTFRDEKGNLITDTTRINFIGSNDPVKPGESVVIHYITDITAADVTAGKADRSMCCTCQGYLYDADGSRIGISFPIFISNDAYMSYPLDTIANAEMFLELVSAEGGHKEGDTVTTVWKLTNTGSLELCVVGHSFLDADGNFVLADSSAHLPGGTAYSENCMHPGEYMLIEIQFTVLPGDVTNGKIFRTLRQFAHPENTDPNAEYSYDDDPAHEVTSNWADAELPLEPAAKIVTLEKQEVSTPQHASFYLEGEAIQYLVKIHYNGNGDLDTVTIYDPDTIEGSQFINGMAPDSEEHVTFTHIVTKDEAEVYGVVSNTAMCDYVLENGESGTEYSNTVISDCGYLEDAGYVLVKKVLNEYPNGEYFAEGDIIHYLITVTNLSGWTWTNVFFDDDLAYFAEGDTRIGSVDEIGPGESYSVGYDYKVTAEDAIYDSLTNSVIVTAHIGADYFDMYAEVTQRIGGKTTDEIVGNVIVTKKEISEPANKKELGENAYYTENETIRYEITYTNASSIDVYDVTLYDCQSGPAIDHTDILKVNESHTVPYEHVVTDKNVKDTFVLNWAEVDYSTASGIHTASSNDVKSPTASDIIDDDGIESGDGKDYCRRVLVSCDGTQYVYTLEHCSEHKAIQAMVKAMITDNMSDTLKTRAWQYTAAMWQDEVEKQFEALFEAAYGAGKAAVLTEKLTFKAMANNFEAQMQLLYGDAKAAELTAMLWERESVELCYILEGGPAARPDHITFPAAPGAVSAAKCEALSPAVAADKVTLTENLCTDHAVTDTLCASFLRENESAETWKFAASLWHIEMQQTITTLYAENGSNDIIIAGCLAFRNWADAHEVLLNLVYADNEAMSAEIATQDVISYEALLCGAKQ